MKYASIDSICNKLFLLALYNTV
jgi:hypothetical protein